MFYLDDLPDMSEYLGNKKSPQNKGVGKYYFNISKPRIIHFLENVKKNAQDCKFYGMKG